MQHQTIATDLLNQINTIGLLENEGNPFTRAIKGEDDLLATIRIKGERLPAFVPGGFSTVIEDMKQAADNNGYIV